MIRQCLPWVEKYRPKTLDDIIGNRQAIASLQALVADGTVPHLILSGPPGSGKTTAVRCMAHQLLGHDIPPTTASLSNGATGTGTFDEERMRFLERNRDEEVRYYSNNVLEINASDDSGVGVVRTEIRRFAEKETTFNPERRGRHKLVILDEADNLTKDAQQALRRMMELHEASTRFILACNDSTRLIEALQSRCTVLRFARLPEAQIAERLRFIASAEKIDADKIEDDGIGALVFRADGDMRNAINDLHTVYAAFGGVRFSHVNAVFDTPRPRLIAAIVECCLAARPDEALQQLVQLSAQGYSSLDILSTLYRVTRAMPAVSAASATTTTAATTTTNKNLMSEQRKLLLLADIGKFQMRALNSCYGTLQLLALVSTMCQTCARN